MAATTTQLILETIVKGTDKAVEQVKSLSSTIAKVSDGMISFGKTASLFVTAPIVAVGSQMIKAASDAVETQNKFEAVFGSLSDEAEKFANTLGDSVNRNVTDIKDGLSSFQAFAIGMGYADDEAIKTSTTLQKLSIDFASFYNITDDEALQRFISAMSGSSEVLDRFGINIKQSALDLELQSLGLADSTLKATELEKAQARLSIITKTLTKQGVVGDAIKTADSYANQLKGLKSDVKTLGETMGNILVPKAREVISFVRNLIAAFSGLPSGIKETIVNIGLAAAALGPLSIGLGAILKLLLLIASPIGIVAAGLTTLGAGFTYAYTKSEAFREVVDSVFTFVSDVVTSALKTVNEAAVVFFDFFDSALTVLGDLFSSVFGDIAIELRDWAEIVGGIFRNVSSIITPIVKALTDFIKSVWLETKDVLVPIFKVLFAPLEIAVRAIYGVVKSVMQLLSGDFEGAFNTIKDTASRIMTALLNLVTNLWELIKNVFKLAITAVSTIFEKLWTTLVSTVTSLGQNVINAFSTVWSQIVEGFTGLVDQAFQWGVNLVTGFVDGIKSIPGKVAEAASSVAKTVKSYLGFSSPTEKGPGSDSDKWAPNFVNMFADGLKNSAERLSQSLSPMAAAMQVSSMPVLASSGRLDATSSTPLTSPVLGGQSSQTNITVKIDTFLGKEEFSRQLFDAWTRDLRKSRTI